VLAFIPEQSNAACRVVQSAIEKRTRNEMAMYVYGHGGTPSETKVGDPKLRIGE
jgi:hypothetical protein